MAGGRRVFISHTSELSEFPAGGSYVTAVKDAVSAAGHVVVDMSGFPAADQPAAQLCAERVQGCDVYIGVLGTRYGSPVRDRPDVSYTELEFDAATAAKLDRLVFLLDTEAADVGIPLWALIDNEYGARQEAFRRRVRGSGLVTASFGSPGELGQLVERSLQALAAVPPDASPPPPGSVLRVWNIPARNPGFVGRDGLLDAVRERLLAGDKTVVQAFQGMGGVGKTQLATEYAHRFADGYDLAWWINCEQPGLIGDQFAALGAALGCLPAGAATEVVRAMVLAELRARDRWLLVFDNAEKPADIAGWLPGGSGHVLITSREHRWGHLATPVEVDVLAREESVAILRRQVAGLGPDEADALAAELGDLPLAVAQAAGFMAETGMTPREYLDLLRSRAGQLLDQAVPGGYPRSLAAATRLIADRLDRDDPAAAQLADLCAFLAPEPIPEDLFTGAPGKLPAELAARAAEPVAWRQTLAVLTGQSLTRIDQRGLVMHRLTQVILRDRLSPGRAAATRARSEAILVASDPRQPDNPVTWPRWARLLPHLLAADLASTESRRLRWMACNACWYLLARGDTRTAYDLASDLRQQWRERLGDDETVLVMGLYSAWALRVMRRYAEARDLDQDTLSRMRRVHGEDHHNTLAAANSLANTLRELGEVEAARDLYQDALNRRRRILGEDHPSTLSSAGSLAGALRKLGEVEAARDLHQDTLNRRRRILGEDHPDTLRSANNLANALRELGELEAARDLHQDTLNRRRRVLGEDHPETQSSARNLGEDLRLLGEAGEGS
jgi:tetratricopeptide (TPR) repeat protein